MRARKTSKTKIMMKWMNNLLTGLLMVLLLTVASAVVITKISGGEPQFFGYQLKTVLSGSMEPGIQTGSIIAVDLDVDATKLQVGDVITFRETEEMLITHRITEVVNSGDTILFRTKGDNNNAEDMNPVLSENVVAQYSGFTIPYVGYFVNFAQSKNGALLLLIPGFLLLIHSVVTLWRVFAQIELPQKKQATVVGEESGNRSS